MIELIFVACLTTAPDNCENRSFLYTGISPMVCMMGAQPELARWAATHPNFRIASWKCKIVNRKEREA